MQFEFHHLNKWLYANLDLVEEVLETDSKAVILVAGASSSGKSYSANMLKNLLNKSGYKSCIISLDQYNVGVSAIIPNKVNQLYFDNKIKNIKDITRKIKKIIYDIPFDKKYDKENLPIIKESIKDLLNKDDLEKFVPLLYTEWKKLNFDEPSVYDMKEASEDVKALLREEKVRVKKYSKVVSERIKSNTFLDGKKYKCIIVEGIYALDSSLLDEFNGIDTIKDFIDGNPKSLFLRRIIRDSKITSADNVFTISAYFKYIIKSYYETIYPSRERADVILNNDMTFSEMRAGDLYTTKLELHTFSKEAYSKIYNNSEKLEEIYQKDTYFNVQGEDKKSKNILRIRSLSNDGVHYHLISLVHKGIPKTRKDDKVIRPINILLNEEEISKVWSTEEECIKDFATAGFLIGPILYKVKTRVNYEGQKLTLRVVKDNGYYIEFSTPPNLNILKDIKNIIKDIDFEEN